MNPWYERNGGFWIACAIHVLLLSLLISSRVIEAKIQKPPPVQLILNMNFEQTQPAEAVEQEIVPPDSISSGDGEVENEAAAVEEVPEVIAEPEPLILEETIEETAEEIPEAEPELEAVEKILEEAETQPEEEEFDPVEVAKRLLAKKAEKREKAIEREWQEYRLRDVQKQQSPSNLDLAIQKEEIRNKGAKFFDDYSVGAATGAFRRFDLQESAHVVKQIFDKYDLRYVTRYLSASEIGANNQYLNSAQTNHATYHATNRPGLYEVLEIGKRGKSKLLKLEYEAIKAAGYNPRKDRLVEIVFGIVKVGFEYDLGVTHIEVEGLRR